jgi:uncharacterized Tic20 family protein
MPVAARSIFESQLVVPVRQSREENMLRLVSISGKLVIVFALILPIFVWQLGKDTIQSLRSYDDMKVLDHQNAAANT